NYQGEERKGFVNNNGSKGGLMRDEFNAVDSQEAYLISTWQLAPRWELIAGVRYNRVEFDSDDDYLIDGQDDSGRTRDHSTNPAIGLNWSWTPELSLYAAIGQGFETPTFQELAYRQDGAGMNRSLKPSESRNAEVGLKWRTDRTRLDLAVFDTRVKDEIVTGANQVFTGRSTYTNAGRSTRRGIELSVEQQFVHGLSGYLAYSWLHAEYDRFVDNSGADFADNRLPGIPRHSFFAELAWHPENTGFHTAIEAQGMSKRYATDNNLHKASGYTVFNWRAGYQHNLGNVTLEPFARLDNLTDRDYIGSLIVNGSGDRYYEPAPGRNWLVGLGLQYQWR
ncbi:MAG: TonB-dependent receptor, partial [Pseudomonas formosensis]|nr:TonB-dependent receptor [Halopseudomonas formosensis]